MKKLGVAEDPKHESVKKYSERVLKEVEANQPEEPKATVIMSEGMAEAAEEILPKYRQERKSA
ncbi:hypothetical protein [Desulfobacter sp.]|uniref:hypothetical protein n=1 Tax=Desulfobacter sp. TaxID=2294 RepID=UPI003D12F5EC